MRLEIACGGTGNQWRLWSSFTVWEKFLFNHKTYEQTFLLKEQGKQELFARYWANPKLQHYVDSHLLQCGQVVLNRYSLVLFCFFLNTFMDVRGFEVQIRDNWRKLLMLRSSNMGCGCILALNSQYSDKLKINCKTAY